MVTTHLYIPSLLSWTLAMVRVLVVTPANSDDETKLLSFSCHWYLSGSAPVVAITVNVTVDPGSIFARLVGCRVI